MREELGRIEEFEGVYGPLDVSEIQLQEIWLRQVSVDRMMALEDGTPLVVLDPGEWNRMEGPDFRNARIRLGDKEMEGDIEIHFHAEDWIEHGHDYDKRYKDVMLHVVLFPTPSREGSGYYYPPHKLVLLGYLDEDLESLAEQLQLEITCRLPLGDYKPKGWASLSVEDRRRQLLQHGFSRLLNLRRRAELRISQYGWEGACHRTTLDLLGVPGNREALQRVALQWDCPQFGEQSFDEVWAAVRPECRLRGMRPANQPKLRLHWYHQLCRELPEWPNRLLDLITKRSDLQLETGIMNELLLMEAFISICRKNAGLSGWPKALRNVVPPGDCGSPKWNMLALSGWIPLLLAAQPQANFLEIFWFTQPGATMPDGYRKWLKLWGIIDGSAYPNCNGWEQGLLLMQHGLERGR